MPRLHIYQDELPTIITSVLDENERHELIIKFANLTEIEQTHILKQMNTVLKITEKILKNKTNPIASPVSPDLDDFSAFFNLSFENPLSDKFKIILQNFLHSLAFVTKHYLMHRNLSAAQNAIRLDQKQNIRVVNHKKKTCKEKIISVCPEIREMKKQNITWTEIITWLKTGTHRKMFANEKLNKRYMQTIYSNWLSSQ